jgi:hypothetical protein
MPMVGGMKFPYTAKGKEDAKKAAAKKSGMKDAPKAKMGAKKAGIQRMLEKKKKSFSGAKTQLY